MKQILVLCALVTLACCSADIAKWQKTEDGSQYFIEVELKFNWFQALNECARMKMSLVSIDSLNKHLQLYTMMKTIFGSKDLRLWIGGNDNAVTGTYEWVTGQAFTFANWAKGEPNSNAEHCAGIWSNSMSWNDAQCSTSAGFICETSPLLSEKNAELAALKVSFDAQTKELSKKNEELEALEQLAVLQTLKEKTEELDALKKSHEILTIQLKQNQEELSLLKNSSDIQGDQLKQRQQELDELQESCAAQATPVYSAEELSEQYMSQVLKPNEEFGTDTSTKESTGNGLEALKIANVVQKFQLRVKSDELEVLKKSNERLTNHLFTEQNRILDALMRPYEAQTNRTDSSPKYYNIVQNFNANPK